MTDRPSETARRILATTVYVDGANRAFGELTGEQTRAPSRRAPRPRSAGGRPRASHPSRRPGGNYRSPSNARAFATVSELEPDVVAEMAPRLWIVPPAGGMMS